MLKSVRPSDLIRELEDSISNGSSERRVDMLRRLTELFISEAASLSDQEIALFDDIIERLADEMELHIRRELASKLAVVPSSPPGITRKLARDDIEVAGVILKSSISLTDKDLVEVASEAGQPHLLAICERPTVSPTVTDVLVRRGNVEVVRAITTNGGARFSDDGFDTLVARAKTDELLQERLGSRSDLPPWTMEALMKVASERVRQRLGAKALRKGHADLLAQAVTAVADGTDVGRTPLDYSAAHIAVAKMIQSGSFGDVELIALAMARKTEEVIVALARKAKLTTSFVETLWFARQSEGLLILLKSMDLNWNGAREFVKAIGGDRSTAAALEAAGASFERLRPDTAQRVVRFWKVRYGAPSAAAA